MFRRMPPKARPAKHLLGEPSSGPYIVVKQSTFSSAQLRDPSTGKMVDNGADIPLEQILCGPRRGLLEFEHDATGARSIGQMIDGKGMEGLPSAVQARGWKPGKKRGWIGLTKGHVVTYQSDTSRELSVGTVLYNDKSKDNVVLHVHRTTWTGAVLRHVKEYLSLIHI